MGLKYRLYVHISQIQGQITIPMGNPNVLHRMLVDVFNGKPKQPWSLFSSCTIKVNNSL